QCPGRRARSGDAPAGAAAAQERSHKPRGRSGIGLKSSAVRKQAGKRPRAVPGTRGESLWNGRARANRLERFTRRILRLGPYEPAWLRQAFKIAPCDFVRQLKKTPLGATKAAGFPPG